MKRLLPIVCAYLLCTVVPAAGGWTVYTNVRDVRRLIVDSEYVYAATAGGLYRRAESGPGTRVFNSGDGLGGHELRALARAGGTFWMGGGGAVLTRFEPLTGDVRKYPLQLDVESIEALAVMGDTLWLGTDIGVGLFLPSLSGGVFKEVYSRLGSLPAEAGVVDLMLFGDRLFVATPFGVAAAVPTDPSLHIASHWLAFADPDGALASTRRFATWQDSLYAATDSGLYVLSDSDFVARLTGRRVHSLFAEADTLWLGTDSGVYLRTADTTRHLGANNLTASRVMEIARVPGGDLWLGFPGNDLWRFGSNGNWFVSVALAQPAGALFSDVAVTGGIVWCAQRGNGASLLHADGRWETAPGIVPSGGAPTYSVSIFHNRAYFPGWGQGLVIIQPQADSFVVTQYTAANSALEPVEPSETYTVIADVEGDAQGGFWAANRFSRNLQSLVYFGPGGSPQFTFGPAQGLGNNDMLVTLLTETRLWIGYNGGGLGVLDFNGTPTVQSDDVYRLYTSSEDRLPSDFITALLEDKDGKIWVGTPGGLARIDPEFFPFLTLDFADVQPADGEILALLADLGNQIWVGTGKGLARLPNGGLVADSVWFAGESPLPDDRVNGLGLDQSEPALWIATANGLAQLALLERLDAAEPDVFPNPLELRFAGDYATFEVPFGSRIDIYTTSGDRVRTLTTENRWDGRNAAGVLVASGLYYFRVTYTDGSIGRGRLGVIRAR